MARKLILAEKPAVARDLARALGMSAHGDGSFAGDRYVITWCIGHLIELCEPAEYNPAWRRWSLPTLPMLPERFQLRPSKSTARQWRVVKELLGRRDFSAVINACDAGREGELIFRYCYELAHSRLPIERLWISSLTEQAIAQGFARLRPGRELDALADAARCRSEADWLVGMNATRAVTLWRRSEQDVLCSLGRVQTPTLGLLVGRERAILEFVPQDYFEVHAALSVPPSSDSDGRFTAIWKHGTQRRLAERPLAETIAERDRPVPAVVESVEEKTVREPPPLLFDLGALQQTANRRFGWSAQRTLSLAQALYEQHKLITYPRTDSRHLSADLIPQLPKIFAGVAEDSAFAPFLPTLNAAKPPRRVFQDNKVTDHHAIIPTPVPHTSARLAALSGDESKLLDLVTRRFLAAFFPDAEFLQTRVVVRVGEGAANLRVKAARSTPAVRPTVAGAGAGRDASAANELVTELPPMPDRYHAQGRVRLNAGWQAVAGLTEERASRSRAPAPRRADGAEAEDEAPEDAAQTLPRLQEGQTLRAAYEVKAKQTQPPPRYNEATLLSAMEGAGKQLDDEALQEVMKDRGLGTPATRASVIETLLDRNYMTRQGKLLQPTPLGMDLIARLPVKSIGSAQLTGEWEARLSRMARGEESRPAFMADIATYVKELVTAVKLAPPPAAVALSAPALASRPSSGARGRSTPSRRGAARTARPASSFGAADDESGTTGSTSRPTRKSGSAASPRTRTATKAGGAKAPAAKSRTAKSVAAVPKSVAAAPKSVAAAPKSSARAPKSSAPAKARAARTKSETTSVKIRKAKAVTAAPSARAGSSPSRPDAPSERFYPDYDAPPNNAAARSYARRSSTGAEVDWGAQLAQPSPSLSREREMGRVPLAANDRAASMDVGAGSAGQPVGPAVVAVGRAVEPPLGCPRCHAGALIWGRKAWGCSNFRVCPLVIPYEFRGRRLGERDLRNLVERGESLPMLLIDSSRGSNEIRARLKLALNGQPDGFLAMVPTQ